MKDIELAVVELYGEGEAARIKLKSADASGLAVLIVPMKLSPGIHVGDRFTLSSNKQPEPAEGVATS